MYTHPEAEIVTPKSLDRNTELCYEDTLVVGIRRRGCSFKAAATEAGRMCTLSWPRCRAYARVRMSHFSVNKSNPLEGRDDLDFYFRHDVGGAFVPPSS